MLDVHSERDNMEAEGRIREGGGDTAGGTQVISVAMLAFTARDAWLHVMREKEVKGGRRIGDASSGSATARAFKLWLLAPSSPPPCTLEALLHDVYARSGRCQARREGCA